VAIRMHSMSDAELREAMYRYGSGESLVTIGDVLGFNGGAIGAKLGRYPVKVHATGRSRTTEPLVGLTVCWFRT